jgi:hypothetical protein
MLGGAKIKSYIIWNYTLLILSYHHTWHDKIGLSTTTNIIKMQRFTTIDKSCSLKKLQPKNIILIKTETVTPNALRKSKGQFF